MRESTDSLMVRTKHLLADSSALRRVDRAETAGQITASPSATHRDIARLTSCIVKKTSWNDPHRAAARARGAGDYRVDPGSSDRVFHSFLVSASRLAGICGEHQPDFPGFDGSIAQGLCVSSGATPQYGHRASLQDYTHSAVMVAGIIAYGAAIFERPAFEGAVVHSAT